MKRIGTLDIATRTGWACDSLDAEKLYERGGVPGIGIAEAAVKHGTIRLPSPVHGEDGPAFVQFERWLVDWIKTYRLEVISTEAPLIAGINFTRTNPDTVEMLIGLYTAAKLVAARMGLLFYKTPRQTVMKHFCGHGRAQKADVVARCRALGWYPADDNAADALALFDYTADMFRRPALKASGPLFKERAAW